MTSFSLAFDSTIKVQHHLATFILEAAITEAPPFKLFSLFHPIIPSCPHQQPCLDTLILTFHLSGCMSGASRDAMHTTPRTSRFAFATDSRTGSSEDWIGTTEDKT